MSDAGITYRWLTEEDLANIVRKAVDAKLDALRSSVIDLDHHAYDETTIRVVLKLIMATKGVS